MGARLSSSVFTTGRIGQCPPLLDFSKSLGDAPLPLWDVIFCEMTLDHLGEQLRYTFFVIPTNLSHFFKNCPPPLKIPINATSSPYLLDQWTLIKPSPVVFITVYTGE